MARYIPHLNSTLKQALNIMNGSPKAEAMFVLADQHDISGTEIYGELVERLGSDALLPKRTAFREYGIQVFVPHAFATKREERYNSRTNVTKFSPTEQGRYLGFAVASIGLDWEATTSVSLAKVLGETSTPGEKRGPETRAEILMYLDRNTHRNLKEIAEDIRVDASIMNRHKKALESTGVITCTRKREMGNEQVLMALTGRGRHLLDTCLYPIYAATESVADLNTIYEAGRLLHHREFGKEILTKALAGHTMKANGHQRR